MAWTVPGSATVGMVLTAAYWNTHVRDNLRVLAGATAITQAVSNGVLTLTDAGDYQIGISGTMTGGTSPGFSKTATATVSSGVVAGRNALNINIGVNGAVADLAASFRVTGVSASASVTWTGDTGSLSGGVIVARQLYATT